MRTNSCPTTWARRITATKESPGLSNSGWIRDLGNVTVVHARGHGHGVGSSAFTEQPFWQVTEWRGGKAIWWHNFLSEAEALEAAGLRE
jgi:hypothetical protein